ncbi:MAG: DinB family protein [Trueperaceae bacterium]
MTDDTERWRDVVATALSWAEAHVSFDAAVHDLDPALRGVRPEGSPHSVWELVEHLRIAQHDLRTDLTSGDAAPMAWPDDYWPSDPVPPTPGAWQASVDAFVHDRAALIDLAKDRSIDLTARVPWGDGRTYLRGLLLAIDHGAYHVGQIVEVRRRLGAWTRSGTNLA